jgi:ElaB/YqjD/DUF883 family membrane-anchored ribosome-binding protein
MEMTETGFPREGETPREVRERLLADVKSLVNDVEDLLRFTANQTGQQIAVARAKAQQSLKALTPRLAQAQALLGQKARAAGRRSDDYVCEHPWQVAGFAAVAALILGLAIGRR